MQAKEFTKEELNMWEDISISSSIVILTNIVKQNELNPRNLGMALAAYELHDHALSSYIRKGQTEMIDWEHHYMTQCYIQEITCYRYLSDWNFGNNDQKHRDELATKWRKFYLENKYSVDQYMGKVLEGFIDYMKTIEKTYPKLDHPWFSYIRESRMREKK